MALKLPSIRLPSAIRIPGADFIRTLLGKEPRLGIDIGTTSIKVAEISPSPAGEGLELTNYGVLETFEYLERSNRALQTPSLTLLEKETASYLKTLLNRGGFKTNLAVGSVPAFSAFTTLIEFPAMSEAEIGKVMKFQAKQYVPLPINQVTIDWQKVGERTDEQGVTRYQVLLVSVVSEQVERFARIFKSAGLRLQELEFEGLALGRALTSRFKEPVLVIDIGSRSTGISVAENGFFKFGGQTDFSGGSLTQTIANALNISVRRAEDLKKLRGLNVSGGERELSTLMEPILDVIINEVKRVKGNFENTYREQVKSAVLAGGGANLGGIERYFSDQLEMPVTRASPLKNAMLIYQPSLDPILPDLGPLLSVAVGLAMKGFS